MKTKKSASIFIILLIIVGFMMSCEDDSINPPVTPTSLLVGTWELDSLFLQRPDGTWDHYKILGDSNERQETYIFDTDSVEVYYNGEFILRQGYFITNTTPKTINIEGAVGVVELLNTSKVILSNDGLKNIWKARN